MLASVSPLFITLQYFVATAQNTENQWEYRNTSLRIYIPSTGRAIQRNKNRWYIGMNCYR